MARSRALTVWLPVLVWAAVIFAFSAVPSLSSGLGGWDLLLRKLAHVTEYAILGALLLRATRRPGLALALAAAGVYKIKYESTLQAERVAKLKTELRREENAIANLRAEWSKLDRPDRIQELAQRHLTLKPVDARHYDALDRLPEKPKDIVPDGTADPIGALVEIFADTEALTGSLPDGGAKPNE